MLQTAIMTGPDPNDVFIRTNTFIQNLPGDDDAEDVTLNVTSSVVGEMIHTTYTTLIKYNS